MSQPNGLDPVKLFSWAMIGVLVAVLVSILLLFVAYFEGPKDVLDPRIVRTIPVLFLGLPTLSLALALLFESGKLWGRFVRWCPRWLAVAIAVVSFFLVLAITLFAALSSGAFYLFVFEDLVGSTLGILISVLCVFCLPLLIAFASAQLVLQKLREGSKVSELRHDDETEGQIVSPPIPSG